MQDILGRELHDGDIVVTKGNQATDKRAMAIGIYRKKSVRIQGGKWRTAKDMFLVENPTAVELGIKEIILREIELEKADADIRKRKTASQIADEVGQIYILSDGYAYLYCGWANIHKTHHGNSEVYDGYVYLPLWYGRDNIQPRYANDVRMNWPSIKEYINNRNISAVMNIKVFKKPGKYQKIFTQSNLIEIPEDEIIDCPAVGFKIHFHFPKTNN